MLRFAALSTPSEDGQVLVEPKAQALAGLVEANQRLLWQCRREILGRPLNELRIDTQRAVLGRSADRPVVGTGHQPEFYHAGVWAKNFVASRLAQAVGGHAVNLVVDNDAPKKTSITVPHFREGILTAHEVPFAEYHAGWAFEQFGVLDTDDADRLLGEIRTALGEAAYAASAMPLMEPALRGGDHFSDFVDQITAARKAVEGHFSLDLIERRVSRCWAGPLLLDILLNAARFAECYNAALADYRQAFGIHGTQRPIPDLAYRGGRVELPVWVYRGGQARRRLFVESRPDALALYADDVALGTVGRTDLRRPDGVEYLLTTVAWSFRPRALTLTLWARLLLTDVFVHGIGGAKYDRIADRLMERYLGIEPPAMACVSATLRMPAARFPVTPADLGTARHKRRDAHYNPQRYLGAIAGDLSERLRQRMDWIAESERLHMNDRLNRKARRAAFLAIRKANQDLLTADPNLLDRLTEEVSRIERQLAHNAVADSREYFFGLLPLAKLAQLAHSLPSHGCLAGSDNQPFQPFHSA